MNAQFDRIADWTMVPFVPADADESQWHAYFSVSESVFREFNPRARIPDRLTVKRALSHPSHLYAVRRAIILADGHLPAAVFSMGYDTEASPSYEEDRHVCQIKIQVEKMFRRKRIGARVLKCLCDTAKKMGKTTVQAESENPVGKKCCEAFGGELVHREVQHRMYLETADTGIAEEWLQKGKKKFPGTRFDFFRDCPEEDIALFSRTYTEIINERPTGEMDQTLITTPESRRIEEAHARKHGIEWYTMISREPDGDISGITDIMYNPREPHKMIQYFTGVSGRHRRKGLARRLKAEMLQVIKEKFPDVEYITTTMAPDNRAMQKINAQLGFKSRKTCHVYQWNIESLLSKAEEKLNRPKKKRKRDCQTDSPV